MKAIAAVIITILTSLFFFPFNSSLMPSVNTKLALSLVGLLFFAYQGFQSKNAQLDKTLTSVSVWALAVSFVGLFSVIINNTSDYTYALYIISAWVWISGAYVVIKAIEWCYGRASLRLVTNFLIAVCVVQCFISQLTDNNETVADWVKSFVVSEGFMGIPKGRLYGIGCALDVAGLKFCAVLILLSYLAVNPSGEINKSLETTLYFLAFLIIGVLGSMISRTTAIGIGMAMILWFIYPILYRKQGNTGYRPFLRSVILCSAILIPFAWYLYDTNEGFHENLRFGFEGFFSLVEKGKWEVHSNEQLMGMWVWPTNLHTWLIGDGYFNNPFESNSFYIGPDCVDFYMGTDIGYCRQVFYFGLIGLATFCGFFINCACQWSKNNSKYSILFWAILTMNFIGWSKVSSDIFPVYALLLLINPELRTYNNDNRFCNSYGR